MVTIELGMSSNQEVQDGGSWILGYHLPNLNSSFLTIALASTNFGMDTYCLPRIVNIENKKAQKDTTYSIIFCNTTSKHIWCQLIIRSEDKEFKYETMVLKRALVLIAHQLGSLLLCSTAPPSAGLLRYSNVATIG